MTASGPPATSAGPHPPGYPAARRDDLVEDLPGHRVPDPYRWLEDAGSAATQEWLGAQDSLWADTEAGLAGRSRMQARIQELMAAGYVSAPAWRGPRQFFMRRLPGQEHGVLLTAATGEPERVLIDPAALDPAGLTTLDSWQPDKEGRLLAYQLSCGGDEESELRVLDVVSGELVDGPIGRCRYSPVAWLPGGKAFYYVRKLPPGQVPPGEEQFHRRVYLHTVGTAADEDVLIFGDGRDKTNYYGLSVSRDGRWLVISAAQGTAPRDDVWLADLTASAPGEPLLQVVQEGVDARTGLHVGRDGRLYVFTDAGAPRGRLAVTDPAHPGPAAGETSSARIRRRSSTTTPSWTAPSSSGRCWSPPGPGTRSARSPCTIWLPVNGPAHWRCPAPATRAAPPGWAPPGVSAPGRKAGTRPGSATPTTPRRRRSIATTRAAARFPTGPRHPARSRCRTCAPARCRSPRRTALKSACSSSLLARGATSRPLSRGTTAGAPGPDQPRPAILYGYGGFGISMARPNFASILAWVEAGGDTRSQRCAGRRGRRGLAPRGHARAQAGRVRRLPRGCGRPSSPVAGPHRGSWVSPAARTWAAGRAAPTQRPELYRAVVCSAPLLDMVRYERFGLGQTWNDEFGTAADPVELGWLLGYSRTTGCAPAPGTRPRCSPCSTTTPGRPGARVEDVRGPAARHVRAYLDHPDPAPPGAGGRPRGPRGQPHGDAVRATR